MTEPIWVGRMRRVVQDQRGPGNRGANRECRPFAGEDEAVEVDVNRIIVTSHLVLRYSVAP